MNLSGVAVSEELSEPEFTHHANSAGVLTSHFLFGLVLPSVIAQAKALNPMLI